MKKQLLSSFLFLLCILCFFMLSCEKEEHSHVFEEWKQISDSSCVEKGESVRRCTVKDCNYTERKYTDLKKHDYQDSITSPTKTKEGYTTHTCKNCSHSFIDTYVPAIGSSNLEYDHIVTDESVTCVITGLGSCRDVDLYIPSYIGKYPVTAIADNAFKNCTTIKSIVIPSGITQIGERSFFGCSNLEKITISNTVEDIAGDAFFYCHQLKGVYISDLTAWCKIDFVGSDSNPLYYAENLFLNDQLITSLTIPNGITEIGQFAFVNATCITEIIIPDGITYIGCQSFFNCGFTSVIVPDSVTKIDVAAFAACQKLTQIQLPQSLARIEMGTFQGCRALKNIMIPETVTSIGSDAFNDCNSLVSISIPENVTAIGSGAFYGCNKLTQIIFESPNGWCSYGKGTSIDVSDSKKNVSIFTDEEHFIYWEKH